MPDASTTTVDGVAPSILVKYAGNANLEDTNSTIILFRDDNGSPREIKLGERCYVTPKEMSLITAGHSIEVINTIEQTEDQTVTPVTLSSVGPAPVRDAPVFTPNPPIQGS